MLQYVQHRPWPLPKGPWIMTQTWNQLLFAHWRVPREMIQELLPPQLEVDTFDGEVWVGILPFEINNIRLRSLPPVPSVTHFPELNVRTYVTYRGRPGIYFFSLDATHRLAMSVARNFYHLPYIHSNIQKIKMDGWIHFESHRVQTNMPPAEFQAVYRPISPPFQATNGSLEHWFTERYRLYTTYRDQLYSCDIHHLPWPLQHAEANIIRNTMDRANRLILPNTKPILHYAETCKSLIWPLERC